MAGRSAIERIGRAIGERYLAFVMPAAIGGALGIVATGLMR